MFFIILFIKKAYTKDFYSSCIKSSRFIFDIIIGSFGPRINHKLIFDNNNNFFLSKRGVVLFDDILSHNFIFLMFLNILTIQKKSYGDGSITIVLLTYSFFKKTIRMFSKGFSLLEINKNYVILFSIVNKILNILAFKITGWKKSRDYFILLVYSNLVSKISHDLSSKYAELCVNASLSVYDYKRNVIKLNLIKVEGRFGSLIEDSYLISGFLLNCGFDNIWVPKKINNALVVLVSNKLDPSPIYDIGVIEVNQIDSFNYIWEIKKNFYNNLIILLKKIKINLLVSQWGLEESFRYLLLKNNISMLGWVGSNNLEILSIVTKTRIIANYLDINFSRVGFSKSIREICFKDHTKILIFDNFYSPKCITIFLMCTEAFILKENKILIKDALKNLSILMKNKNFLVSSGYSELIIIMILFNLNSKYFCNSNDFLNCFIASLEILPILLLQYPKKISMIFIEFFKKKSTELSHRPLNRHFFNSYIETKSLRQSIYYLTFKTVFILINISKLVY